MKRGHVKVLLAVGFTLLVAGTIFFGLGRSQASNSTIRATRPDSPRSIGNVGQSAATAASPSTRVTVARPFQTRPLRSIAPRRADRLAARGDESEGAYGVLSVEVHCGCGTTAEPGEGHASTVPELRRPLETSTARCVPTRAAT